MSLEDKIKELAKDEAQASNWLKALSEASDAKKSSVSEWAESAEKGDYKGFFGALADSKEDKPAEKQASSDPAPANRQASPLHKPNGYSGYPSIAR